MPRIQNLASGESFVLVPKSTFVVGRSKTADLLVPDVYCSRRQFSIEVTSDGDCHLNPLSTTSTTFCEGMAIHDGVRLDRDVQITAGKSHFRFILSDSDPQSRPPPSTDESLPQSHSDNHSRVEQDAIPSSPDMPASDMPEPDVLAMGTLAGVATSVGDPLGADFIDEALGPFADQPIRIARESVIGRDPKQADIVIPHVQVSRRHARIVLHRDGAILTDLDSSGGTFVNGQVLTQPTRIRQGDRIGIGPYQFIFDHGFLTAASHQTQSHLVARGLTKTVPDRLTGHPKTILDDVSLVIEPGQFVCLLGPAGCGKSTLLAALSGRAPADTGSVTLNNADLYQEFEQLKHDLALVPQRDCLHRSLTIEEALRYTARLRLPSDTSREELQSVVARTIASVGLTPHSATRIADLSGGQTKRTSLAIEILANPSVIFLDEVTSGLDEQSDRETMELFRQLADQGKTLVCVTHHLSNVRHTCHRIVVLAESGNLAFVGTPDESLAYFNVDRIGDIYAQLKTQPAGYWRTRFQQSEFYVNRIGRLLARSPQVPKPHSSASIDTDPWEFQTVIRQTPILISRYYRLLSTDRQAILATLGQCLLVAVLIALVFGDITITGQTDPTLDMQHQAARASSLLFITAISCFWFGCSNASKEFVKERDIYLKEFHAGLNPTAYFLSKLAPLWIISLLQAMLLYGIVAYWCHLPTSGIGALAMGIIAAVGVTLGLVISAIAKSEDVATVVVPMVLIPQIILSEGLKPLEGLAAWIAKISVSLYWGFGMLRSDLTDGMIAMLESPPTSRSLSIIVLVAHGVAFSLVALRRLRWIGTRRT